MCCKGSKRPYTAAAFIVLSLGMAVWGVVASGVVAFWVGWSMAALSMGYVLASRMEFLGKITNIISKTPGVPQTLHWASLALFVDVHLLMSHQTSLWGLSTTWLLEHTTLRDLIPFFVSFGLFFLVILPSVQVAIAPFKAAWRGTLPAKEEWAVELGRLQCYVLQNDDKWAKEIYTDAVSLRDEAKQVETSGLSILLLLVTDFLLGEWAGVLGVGYALFGWLLGLPTMIAAIMGLASLNVVLFIAYVALRRDNQLDGWVKKERFGKSWLEKHGIEFWGDNATKQ